VVVHERILAWDGCLNVRDLGGLPTEDGGETRYGAIVRADSVRKLSDAGWEALVDHGVRTIVDLRFESELAADPPHELPVDMVHVPVLPDRDSHDWSELDALMLSAPDEAAGVASLYGEFLARYADRFATAVAAVADADEGAVVVHCVGGKDRTGLVNALVLRLANVPVAAVADDYAVSVRNLETRDGPWIAEATDEHERERRRRIAASPRDAMLQVLADVEERYGGARAYLLQAGLEDEAAERVRARLRSDP
jgi:protein-tyrosine phosphatase